MQVVLKRLKSEVSIPFGKPCSSDLAVAKLWRSTVKLQRHADGDRRKTEVLECLESRKMGNQRFLTIYPPFRILRLRTSVFGLITISIKITLEPNKLNIRPEIIRINIVEITEFRILRNIRIGNPKIIAIWIALLKEQEFVRTMELYWVSRAICWRPQQYFGIRQEDIDFRGSILAFDRNILAFDSNILASAVRFVPSAVVFWLPR